MYQLQPYSNQFISKQSMELKQKVSKGWTIPQMVALVFGILLGVILLGIVGVFIAALTDPDESDVVIQSVDDKNTNSAAKEINAKIPNT